MSTTSTTPAKKNEIVDIVDIVEGGRHPTGTRQKTKLQSVHLELLGNGSPDRFIGVHAVPNRLPELLRYPGETAQAFCARALHQVQGAGALVAYLMYATPSTCKVLPAPSHPRVIRTA